MNLTPEQKRLCVRVVNVFETGTPDGDYAKISRFKDGPHKIRQITYGRSQTTEYGNLRELVIMYVTNHGSFADQLAPYIPKIGITPLVGDAAFERLLQEAARTDSVMRATQDEFFDRRYFDPAVAWATKHGFKAALSGLVIYDSFIHSGGVLGFLRARFEEPPPSKGGSEDRWVTDYVNVRHQWLASHSNTVLRPTVYRTKCFQAQIKRGNWDLSQLPILANGTKVS